MNQRRKRRPTLSKQARTTIPVRALDRIRESGGSAFTWYEQSILSYTDPNRTWQRAGSLLQTLGILAAVALTVAAIGTRGPIPGAAALVILLGGLARTRFSSVPPVASVLVCAVALLSATFDVSVVTVLALIGVLVLVWGAALRRTRDIATGCAMTAWSVCTAVEGQSPWGYVAVLLTGAAGLGGEWLASGSAPWGRGGRMTAETYRKTPPPLVFQSPWLTRVMALSEKAQRAAPPDLVRKKAGAWGERRTALLLLGLRSGRGTRIVHDVVIPGAANANADHVVAARSGWYVIDSKQFGTTSDPGVVRFDREQGRVEHINGAGKRDLTGSARTLLWACGAIGHAVNARPGLPGAPRGILAIHNAQVEEGLVLQAPDGTQVDVLPAGTLAARIDGSRSVLGRSDLVQAKFRMASLRSAAHGGSPMVVAPLGSWIGSNGEWFEDDTSRAMPIRGGYATPQPAPGDATPPPTEDQGAAAPDTVDVPVDQAGDGWVDQPPPETMHAPAWEDRDPLRGPMRDVDGTVQEEWLRMQGAPDAAADDVPHEFRDVQRGSHLTHIKFDDGTQSLFKQDVVALRGPCMSTDGPYVWVCTLEQWDYFQRTQRPVRPATLKVENLMKRAM